jgi:hypothetical protein
VFALDRVVKLDISGEQFVDALGRVMADTGDDAAELHLGIEAFEVGGLDDRALAAPPGPARSRR